MRIISRFTLLDDGALADDTEEAVGIFGLDRAAGFDFEAMGALWLGHGGVQDIGGGAGEGDGLAGAFDVTDAGGFEVAFKDESEFPKHGRVLSEAAGQRLSEANAETLKS